MKQLQNFFTFIILLTICHQFTLGLSVTATVDRTKLTLEDIFELKIEAVGGSESPQVNLSPLKKYFIIVSGPSQQTNISWENGKMKSIRGLSWTLSPKKTGTLILPALSVSVGKTQIKTNTIKLHVSKNNFDSKAANSNGYFIKVIVNKNKAYLGEQITVTYELYTQNDISIESVDLPEFVGFWTENLYSPRQISLKNVSLNGVRYKKAKLYTVALFPTKLGEITLPSYTINSKIYVDKKKSRKRDPFFDVFDSFTSRQTVRKIIKSEIKKIHILPYPDGEPNDFTGAVGNYTVKSSVDIKKVKTNEAVTFVIDIVGTGNLSLFSLPELIFPKSLEVFPPVSEMNKDSFRDEITGSLRWEYVIIPRQTGRFNLPKIELPYFDPKKRMWKRAISHPIQISVSPGSLPLVATEGLTKEEVELLGKDIRYHRNIIPKWQKGDHLSFLAILFYSVAFMGFVIPSIVNTFQKKNIHDIKNKNSRYAYKNAIKSLNNVDETDLSSCASALYKFLKDKFYLKSDKIDPTTVKKYLKKRIDTNTLGELIKLLNQFDEGRFSPETSKANRNLKLDTISMINQLDQYEK